MVKRNPSEGLTRVEVRLVGIASSSPAVGRAVGASSACSRQTVERAAMAEAQRLLQLGPLGVWSHAFRVDEREFLLSTYLQEAHEVQLGRIRKQLPPRLVIEVSPAPRGLSRRTLLRAPRPPGKRVGMSREAAE